VRHRDRGGQTGAATLSADRQGADRAGVERRDVLRVKPAQRWVVCVEDTPVDAEAQPAVAVQLDAMPAKHPARSVVDTSYEQMQLSVEASLRQRFDERPQGCPVEPFGQTEHEV